uniref:ADAM cysteine-rich domain-containing protein n=1 Tax=Plectus sambesii TaxID=2011161 RepID=A0A914VR35_9BILA
ACFERFNSLGVEHGNCGRNGDHSYRRCDLRNSVCGMLHCQNGSSSATDARWMSFNSKFIENGRQLE